jgi:hypothetical protein
MSDQNEWPVVDVFAREMKAKLEENKHKGLRGGEQDGCEPATCPPFGGWLWDAPADLLRRVGEELLELSEAVAAGAPARHVIWEAADVANMAMMVCDAYTRQQTGGGLLESDPWAPGPVR